MSRVPSPSDLADAEWAVISPLLPPPARIGRPEAHARPDILDANSSHLRQGGARRGQPNDLPPWQTVCWRVRRCVREGARERVMSALRERDRARQGRHPQPAAS